MNRSRIRFSSAAYCSSVYSLNQEFFRVGVIARIDPDFLDPFRRFHRGFRFEMDVGHNRHIAAALAQTFDDVFEIAASFTVGAVMRTISQPTVASSIVCAIDASVSIVSHVIIDWTRIGFRADPDCRPDFARARRDNERFAVACRLRRGFGYTAVPYRGLR